jgi:hypothetical protein
VTAIFMIPVGRGGPGSSASGGSHFDGIVECWTSRRGQRHDWRTRDRTEPGRGALSDVRDGAAVEAIAFYKEAFGAEEHFRQPDDNGKRLLHCHLVIDGASVMLSDELGSDRGPPPSGVHSCGDLLDFSEQAKMADNRGPALSRIAGAALPLGMRDMEFLSIGTLTMRFRPPPRIRFPQKKAVPRIL